MKLNMVVPRATWPAQGFGLVAGVGLITAALLSGACASSGGSAAAPTAINQPADLLGTRWTLPMSEKGRDGRTIEFKYGADHRIHAVLTKVGDQLDKVVGAHEGAVIMELVPAGPPRTYAGTQRTPGKDHVEVLCSVSVSGSELKCNTEDWVWHRQS
jgi:hypothetical protein